MLLFYLTNILGTIYLLRLYIEKKYLLRLETQDFEEKLNILADQNSRERKNQVSLQEKITRYNSLKKIIEDINQNVTLEFTANSLTDIAFSLIAKNKGTCILYLIDNQNPVRLNLYKTRREDQGLVIKAKEGDIFDAWVLRHSSPLLVEDIRKDFRFDLEKLFSQDARPISSLISAPLISEQRFLGILRLDHSKPEFYAQDDLRFLAKICDLGAVALENSELFQKTQDLAIHDGLTGLFTKGYFLEHLKEECTRCARHQATLSLLMLDIDYFKNYNDKFGHTAGDIALKKLSLELKDALKKFSAAVCRYGGEEFYVALSDTDKKKAMVIAEELRARIEKMKIVLRRYETNISVSIGISVFPGNTKDCEELLFLADRAMYQAKQEGRNRVVCA
ncbi:MAG: sensor domain-containing diguanylate cyclase [Candidatus Omnitrophota bacterium]